MEDVRTALQLLVNYLESDPSLYDGDDDGALGRVMQNANAALNGPNLFTHPTVNGLETITLEVHGEGITIEIEHDTDDSVAGIATDVPWSDLESMALGGE
jgi:hypothetical protein